MAQPTVYRQMLEAGMDCYDLSSINCYAVGGEKLTKDVSEGVYRQTGFRLFEGYAQSEAGLIAANSKNMGRKPNSVGKILPKYHVEILKDDGSFAPPGEQGEIVLVADQGNRPVGLLMGYFEDPEADASLWDGDLFHTGDIGYMDEDGFLFYLGRSDGLIKTRGYRVSPFEIENELSHHPAVYECMAVGEVDEAVGQRIKVYVRLAEGFSPSEALKQELLHFHNDTCTGFKKVQTIEFVSEFTRNHNGKIIRTPFVQAKKGVR
jgi:acetyl-CoA synthetase